MGAKEVIQKYKDAAKKLPDNLYKAMQRITLYLAGYVKTRKLTGQVLHVRTGRLRNSIIGKAFRIGNIITGKVGTNVEYARIWELGGRIPAHDIRPKYKEALKFVVAGNTVICKVVHQPARDVKARPFLRPTLAENKDRILRDLGNAVQASIS